MATGRRFSIGVAFDHKGDSGRALAEATFHRFADHNWDTSLGAPSFVTEPPGGSLKTNQEASSDTRQYVANIALLVGRNHVERAARVRQHVDAPMIASD
jgi:hypothetical protein